MRHSPTVEAGHLGRARAPCVSLWLSGLTAPLSCPRFARFCPRMYVDGFAELRLDRMRFVHRDGVRTPPAGTFVSHSAALRRSAETRCRVTPKRLAICSIVKPSA